jgi:hypothetical protein
MPLLPNLGDIPQAQFDKIVAAFPGTTAAEKTQSYKDWLTNRLLDQVEAAEMQKARIAIAATLPTRPPDPVWTT